MKYWAIRYGTGDDLGRASRDEQKIRAAFAQIEPSLRERCEVVCLVEERAHAETIRPEPPDPFSHTAIRQTLETLPDRPAMDEAMIVGTASEVDE